jgi:hypothetical protein
MTTATFKAITRNPLDRALWALLALLVALSLYFNLAQPAPAVTVAPAPAVVVDLYAPARNAEEQAVKDRRAWDEKAALLAAKLGK